MKNSGLLKVISTFSKDEMKDFEKLVASPFFSTGRNLTPLLNVLKKYHPDFENVNLKKEKVFEKLYPGKIYSETVIRKLTTELYHLSIEYIKQISMRKNPLHVNYCSSFELINRNLDSFALKQIDEITSDIDKNKIGTNYFLSKPLTNISKSYFYYNKRSMQYYKEIMAHRADTFNFIVKNFFFNLNMGYISISSNLKRYEAENLDLKYIKIIDCMDIEKFQYVFNPESKDKSEIIILMSIYSLLTIKDPCDQKYFEKFRDLFFRNICNMENDLVVEYKATLFNLLIFKEKQLPKIKLLKLKFETINYFLKNNLYIDLYLKVFPKNDFKDFFLCGYNLEEYEWAENFLKRYSKYLNSDERDYTVNLCLSFIYFANGKFKECVDCLNLINIDHPTEKLAHYYLRASAMYELEYYDESESVLNAYSKFIERDNLAHSKDKDQYINYICCLKHLIHFNFTKNKSHLFDLNELLKDETKTVTMKKWLINKLNEAENLK